MKQWEYCYHHCDQGLTELDKLGLEGWEAVGYRSSVDRDGDDVGIVLLKRELPPGDRYIDD